VCVYRKLKVALIATGDELKLPRQALTSSDIYESNSFVLRGMLEKPHVDIIDFGVIEDDFDAIKSAFYILINKPMWLYHPVEFLLMKS
tara:strand:- start:16561 stop:16824 length:264 start_codon:yes stop_codon:yes gene_type:complete